MKRVSQKLFSLFIVLAMVLSMVPAVKVSAATGTAWSGGSFSASGEYYLTGDITLTEAITISSSRTITLDLNGNTITVGEGVRGFYVNGGKLTIKDSGTGGSIVGSGVDFSSRGGLIYVKGSAAVLTLESGTISGGRATERGGNIYVENGTFNMTGGAVSDGYAADRGGNIASTGKINISGGTVSGGYAADRGGNIVSTGASCPVSISGSAVITGGNAKSGGNIALVYSVLNMSGGTISAGYASSVGGNIHTYGSDDTRSTVDISGGTIEDVAAGSAASMFLTGQEASGCLITISGGTVKGVTRLEQIASITLSGAPVIENLRLSAGTVVTPVDLTQGADIGVEPADGYTVFTGLLADAESYIPYFSSNISGYGVGVVDNKLALVPACQCGCGLAPEAVEWTALTATEGALAEGHYYVPEGGLTLTAQYVIASNTAVTIDLRGNTLQAAEAARVFSVSGKLSIMDSSEDETGKVVGGTMTATSDYGASAYLNSGGSFYLYSGTVTGGTAYRGGNIYMSGASNVVVLAGGAVTDGTALGASTTTGRGGNIYQGNGSLTIKGDAVVSGGDAQRWVPPADHTDSNNSARGGNIFVNAGSVVITGNAQITGGNSGQYGGNVMFYACDAEVSGNARITGGTSDKYGRNIASMNSDLTITGNAYVDAGAGSTAQSVYLNDTGSGDAIVNTLTISGGTVEGQIYVSKTKELGLSGAPKVEFLNIATGMQVTSCELTEGAEICVKAADAVFSAELTDGAAQAAYFTAYQSGYTVAAVGSTLGYGTACTCGCGDLASNVIWNTWSGGYLIDSGHYKLSKAATLEGVMTVEAGENMVVDLNGKTLTAAADSRAFYVEGSLTILDSASGGTLTGGSYMGTSGTNGNGGNIYVADGGVFTLRSGTISGGYASQYGGNICTGGSGAIYMYGGTVTDGSSGERGGNVYLSSGNMYMTGGTITDGETVNRGGNLFVNGGDVYMTGGKMTGGTTTASSSTYGGNVMLTGRGCDFHLSGSAYLSKGTAETATNIGLMYANLYVSGGTVYDGTIYGTESNDFNFPGLYISGGTISCTTITMGGDIDDGKAALVAITGGTITGSLKLNYASSVIISGAPSIAKMDLGSTVRITPVDITEGTVIPISASGDFTTELTDADSYIQYFSLSEGEIVNNNGVLSVNAVKASGTSGNIKWSLSTGGVLTITGSGSMTNYTYSSIYNNLPWKSYLTSIKKVVIEEGVTTIGNNAFRGCTNLTSVELPSTVTSVGSSAFYDCTSLTDVDLASVKTIGSAAFYGCTALTELTIPNSVTTINTSAFNGCTALTTVNLGTGVTSIGNSAFNGCTALTSVYYTGTSSQYSSISVGSNNTAFTGVSNLVVSYNQGYVTNSISWNITGGNTLTVSGSGEMPGYYRNSALSDFVGTPWSAYAGQITKVVVNGFTSVGEWAFYNLDKLTTVTLSGSVTKIEANAFRDCDKLTTITIPSSVTIIGENAFYGCDKLATVSGMSGAKTIGNYAFYDCDALTGITIPASVTTIGKDAFADCDAMTAITVDSSNTSYLSVNGVLYDWGGLTLIRVPCGFSGSLTVPNSVGTIEENAFANCNSITDVVISENVSTIEDGAFFGSSVTTVTLGKSVATISNTAFNDCGNMTAFICDGNTNFTTDAAGALYTADGATLVQVPGGITGTFTVAETATAVGRNAAAWNKNLSAVTLYSPVTVVNRYAFAGSGFKTFNLTAGTTNVNKGAFESAAVEIVNFTGTEKAWASIAITTYNAPLLNAKLNLVTGGNCGENLKWEISANGVLTITGTGEMTAYTQATAPWYASCTGITAIVIGDGVTGISENAFYGCTNVTTVTVPLTLTTVGANAFGSCASLTDVNYAGTRFQWRNVTVGDGNTNFSNATFHYNTATLTEISIQTMPTKLEYKMGDTVDTTGIVLLLTYSDGSTEEVSTLTEEYVVTADLSQRGSTTVTITYKEKSVTYTVEVAASGTCGENVTWSLLDGVLTLSGTGEMTYFDAKTSAPWWNLKEEVTTVVVEEGITGRISRFAFYQMVNLTSVSLPEGITFLGSSSFYGCSSLEEIVIPNSVTGMSSTVFGANSSLTTVTFGEKVKTIGDGAFKNCTALETVNYGGSRVTWAEIEISSTDNTALTDANIIYAIILPVSVKVTQLPDKVKYIQGEALDTTGLVLTTVYDDGSEEVYSGEFSTSYDETATGTVTVTVTAGEYAVTFDITVLYGGITADGVKWYLEGTALHIECEGPMPDYSLENPAPWVADYYDVFYFDDVVFGDAVTSVGAYAFYGCGEMINVTLPDTITAIGAYAFANVTAMETITIGENVTTIGAGACNGCEYLAIVNYGGNSVTWNLIDIAEDNEELETAIFNYGMSEPTGIKVSKLPTKTQYLIWDTLDATGLELVYTYDDSQLETPYTGEFTATAEFTAIGDATVTVTAAGFTTTCTVTVLPSGYCSDDGESIRWSLVDGKLTLSGTGVMTYYGSRDLVPWWNYKASVTSVVVEEGITGRISRFAFYNCSNMLTASLPEGITYLGSSAFYGCSSLQEIVIPDSVEGMSSTTFGANAALTTVTFGENMEEIGEGAFKNCTALITVNYGGSRTTWAAIEIAETNNEALLAATVNYARVDVTSVEITAQPNKLVYFQGEELNTEGMEVTIHKDDGTSQVVTDYTVDVDMTAVGNVTVTVSHSGKTTQFPISIGYGGYTADGLFWQFADGVLTVDYLVDAENPGTGAMQDYTAETPAPWAVHASDIQSLVIGEGVTSIGTYAFAECSQMTSVIIPVGMTNISENAFLNCTTLENVTFTGTEAEWRAITIAATGNETLLEKAPVSNSTLGDINDDGTVNFGDLGALQAYLTGKISEIDQVVADINSDGTVNFGDLGALQAYLTGKATIGE